MSVRRFTILAAWGMLGLALVWLLTSSAPPSAAAPPCKPLRVSSGLITVCPSGDCDFATIQGAVDAANHGDIIKIAGGTYTGVHGRTAPEGYPNPPANGVITQLVYITKTVTIRGGYTTEFIEPPDADANPTTLDAQGQGRVLLIAGGITTTIEGLRITGGDALGLGGDDYLPSYHDAGGGVYVVRATVIISNNQVFSNTAGSGPYSMGHGGGLYVYGSDTTLTSNSILSNSAGFYGSGLYMWDTNATLTNNSFISNRRTYQGGGLFVVSSRVTLIGNLVRANSSAFNGGVLIVGSTVTMSDNTIVSNVGGGISISSSDGILTNNIIANNQVDTSGRCGLCIGGSSFVLAHNTIARNIRNSGEGGYGIRVGSGSVTLSNTILVGHTVGITVAEGSTATLEATLWGSGSWANGTDWGGAGTMSTGTVNVWGAPAFVDPDGGDYHIGSASAAIDVGADAEVTTDIDGDARPWGYGYDIGADELANLAGRGIERIEVNQALGRQYGGAHKFVAGKDTAIRIFLVEAVKVNSPEQYVVVERDGSTVTTLYPLPSTMPVTTLTFLCSSRADCGNWEAGDYTFHVAVDGEVAHTTATFQNRQRLRVLAVPVKVKDRGVVTHLPDTQWMTADGFLRQVYPIANARVDWEPGSELDATSLDLTSRFGRARLWWMLKSRQPRECAVPNHLPCYDKIIGFIPAMPICDDGICLRGWTYPDLVFPRTSANVVMANGTFTNEIRIDIGDDQVTWVYTETVDSMEALVAHEVGHNYALGDEYNNCFAQYQCSINPPPSHYAGLRWGLWSPLDCDYSCSSSDAIAWEDSGTGSTALASEHHPYEVGGRGALGDKLSFMGSGASQSDYWIALRVYDHLFDALAPSALTGTMLQESTEVIQVSGWIGQDDSVTLEPWYQYTTMLATPTMTGTYTIEAVDEISQTMASQRFEVLFFALTNPPTEIDPAPFQAVVDFRPGTHALRLRHGDTVLRIVTVSPNSPSLAITAPISGEVVSGKYTIEWQASDLDGDQLHHMVEYSPDGQDWQVLAGTITQTQWLADFDSLPGGDQALIRVTTSDGVNTSQVTSAPFVVSPKPPEVFVSAPAPRSRYRPGSNVTLRGSAYDYQDGWLRSDTSLTWTSDRDGVLGFGEVLNLQNMSAGEHTVTLRATNSQGLSSTGKVVMAVGVWVYLPVVLR